MKDTGEGIANQFDKKQLKPILSLYSKGKFSEAIIALESLITSYPEVVTLFTLRGACYKKSGLFKQAIKDYQYILTLNPDDRILFDTHYQLVKLFIKSEERKKATDHCLSATLINTNDAKAHYNLGNTLLKLGQLEVAVKNYEQALAIKPDYAEAHYNLGKCYVKLLKFSEAKHHLSLACQTTKPNSAKIHYSYACVLYQQGERDEAITHLRKSIQFKPDFEGAKLKLNDILSNMPVKKQRFNRWPILMSEIDNLYEAAQKHVIDHSIKPIFNISDNTSFFTLGSCFAENLALSLASKNINVLYSRYAEEINSTFANLHFLEWATNQLEDSELCASFSNYFEGVTSKKIVKGISEADVIIFTIGVAPCFFSRVSKKFILPKKNHTSLWSNDNDFRMTTVNENHENLLKITNIIQELNPSVNIVFTISPVPLKAFIGSKSIVQADTISKSVLRVAIHEVMDQSNGRVSYWPSYEIVRGLGMYFSGTYGVDDGRSRHVSKHVVDIIIRLFLEHHGYCEKTSSEHK
jgi:tetratricopeptide (TPR) repeat protein